MAQAYVQTPWKPKGDAAALVVTSARLNNMEAGIYLSSAPIVTSLPASPVDGQECNLLVDATNAVVWHLIYRAAEPGPYKWYFTGGDPLFGEDTSVMTPGAALSTNTTPAVTLPNAGDYLVEHGALVGNGASVADASQLYLRRLSDNADLVASIIFNSPAGAAASFYASIARHRRLTGMTAGTTVVQRGTNVNSVAQVSNRWVTARPYRIG